jgi:hypothetical protein
LQSDKHFSESDTLLRRSNRIFDYETFVNQYVKTLVIFRTILEKPHVASERRKAPPPAHAARTGRHGTHQLIEAGDAPRITVAGPENRLTSPPAPSLPAKRKAAMRPVPLTFGAN